MDSRFPRPPVRPGLRVIANWIALAAARSGCLLTVALPVLAALGAAPGPARAAALTVTVRDVASHALAEVAVTLTPAAARAPAATAHDSGPHALAVMDQRQLEFLPQVLVIAAGDEVSFPNNDSVSHQVYSFSKAKPFQLSLYKGRSQPPVTFERPGLVVLGCNIHDEMVGYVYVTDAAYFGKTASDGALTLSALPDGDYRLTVWSPRIADAAASLTRELRVGAGGSDHFEVRLTRPLRAQPEPRPRRPDWEY